MSVAGRELSKPGKFETHRTLTGAAAADNATINDTNFPVVGAFFGEGCDSVWVYWSGTGGTAADTAAIQPLIRDGVNDFWVRLATVTFVKDVAQEITVRGAGQVFLRLNAVTTTATDLRVRVAKASQQDVG